MSANEVIEQVKALPPRERRKFFKRIHDLETRLENESLVARKSRVHWPDGEARRAKISVRPLPNLVLKAREEERY